MPSFRGVRALPFLVYPVIGMFAGCGDQLPSVSEAVFVFVQADDRALTCSPTQEDIRAWLAAIGDAVIARTSDPTVADSIFLQYRLLRTSTDVSGPFFQVDAVPGLPNSARRRAAALKRSLTDSVNARLSRREAVEQLSESDDHQDLLAAVVQMVNYTRDHPGQVVTVVLLSDLVQFDTADPHDATVGKYSFALEPSLRSFEDQVRSGGVLVEGSLLEPFPEEAQVRIVSGHLSRCPDEVWPGSTQPDWGNLNDRIRAVWQQYLVEDLHADQVMLEQTGISGILPPRP